LLPVIHPAAKPGLKDYCGQSPLLPCKIAYHIDPHAARFVHNWDIDLWTNKIVAIAVTLALAFVARRLTHRAITNVTTRMATGIPFAGKLREKTWAAVRSRTGTVHEGTPILLNERRRQRAETMGSLLRSVASVLILGSAVISVVGLVGLNLTPFLASASIVGVAVAFGAQNLVKDFLSGIFMLLEDQYGVGDSIDVGLAKGTVEEVTLRVTKIRDLKGVVWYVRNGTIQRVGNESQNWARVVLDIPVGLEEDIDHVRDVLQKTADDMALDPDWKDVILEDPSVWGVQELTSESVVVRVTLKTAPGEQNRTARELRERVKIAFDEAGVSVGALPEK
jgi:small conductance mechanosensitive channel